MVIRLYFGPDSVLNAVHTVSYFILILITTLKINTIFILRGRKLKGGEVRSLPQGCQSGKNEDQIRSA